MIKSVIKRDGRVVLFDEGKIAAAVLKALEAAGEGDAREAARVANKVSRRLEVDCGEESPSIEQIQDAVESGLMECGHDEAAKRYILYRANRTRIREANTSLMKTIDEITNVDARISDMKRDNANIDGNTAMGSMLQIGTAGAKAYNAAYLLTPEQAKANYAEHEGRAGPEDQAAFAAGMPLGGGETCLPAVLYPLGPGRSLVDLREGMYHQVRRMLAARGMPVTYLRRIAFGGLELGDLPPGQGREVALETVLSPPCDIAQAGSRWVLRDGGDGL